MPPSSNKSPTSVPSRNAGCSHPPLLKPQGPTLAKYSVCR